MKGFIELINSELEKRNMSVSSLARLANISIPYMHELLRDDGKKRWNEDTIQRVTEALGISIKYEVELSKNVTA